MATIGQSAPFSTRSPRDHRATPLHTERTEMQRRSIER